MPVESQGEGIQEVPGVLVDVEWFVAAWAGKCVRVCAKVEGEKGGELGVQIVVSYGSRSSLVSTLAHPVNKRPQGLSFPGLSLALRQRLNDESSQVDVSIVAEPLTHSIERRRQPCYDLAARSSSLCQGSYGNVRYALLNVNLEIEHFCHLVLL